MAARRGSKTLTTFDDGTGRKHRVVLMADRLLLDLVGAEPPRVIALLRHDEGIEQAEAIVFGRDGEKGYAERASRERGALCRAVDPADLRAPDPDPVRQPGEDEWPEVAA